MIGQYTDRYNNSFVVVSCRAFEYRWVVHALAVSRCARKIVLHSNRILLESKTSQMNIDFRPYQNSIGNKFGTTRSHFEN